MSLHSLLLFRRLILIFVIPLFLYQLDNWNLTLDNLPCILFILTLSNRMSGGFFLDQSNSILFELNLWLLPLLVNDIHLRLSSCLLQFKNFEVEYLSFWEIIGFHSLYSSIIFSLSLPLFKLIDGLLSLNS